MLYKLLLLLLVVPALTQKIWSPNKNTCPSLIKYPFAFNPISLVSRDCYHNPNVGGTPTDIVKRAGYPYEEHYVTTDDGYVLMIARVPQKKQGAQPVLLMHFLAGSCTIWLDRYNQSLAYALHDEGYDVWAGNVRGNTYSKKHVNLSPKQSDFWDFNLDTVADHDIPAILKYIAKETGQGGNIIYGGVSMGTTVSYMYLINKPEEAHSLIRGLIHFAPVGYIHNSPTFKTASYVRNLIALLSKVFRIKAMFEPEHIVSPLIQEICKALPHFCKLFLDVAIGNDSGQLDPRDFLLEFSAAIRPTSIGQFLHYFQMAGDGKFQKYDYGKEKNLEVYGQEHPPQYDLSKVKVPTLLLYGENDRAAVPKDSKRTFKELGSKIKMIKSISVDNKVPFNHLAFNYGKDDKTLLFPHVIDFMKKYLKPE